jgi:uncharacterized protein YqgC (DUF456 family)
MPSWEELASFVLAPLIGVVGVLLTALQLPGPWVIVVASIAFRLLLGDAFSWWAVAGIAAIATLGEVIEFFASAVGANRGGAGPRGALAAMAGGLVGAIAGLFVLPPIGPIVLGAVGAGAGTLLVERYHASREWKEAARACAGAAIGRLVATVAKVMLAATAAAWMCTAVYL